MLFRLPGGIIPVHITYKEGLLCEAYVFNLPGSENKNKLLSLVDGRL